MSTDDATAFAGSRLGQIAATLSANLCASGITGATVRTVDIGARFDLGNRLFVG
jgi:hypothetical protein